MFDPRPVTFIKIVGTRNSANEVSYISNKCLVTVCPVLIGYCVYRFSTVYMSRHQLSYLLTQQRNYLDYMWNRDRCIEDTVLLHERHSSHDHCLHDLVCQGVICRELNELIISSSKQATEVH